MPPGKYWSSPASSIRTSTFILPFMGTFAKDTYETASRAALVGGTTTLIEMVCPSRADDPLEAYELWKSKAAGQSACDYAFHMGVTRFDDKTPDVAAPNRRRRHGLVQSLSRVQRGVRRRRRRAVSHAGTGQALGRYRHRPLRKRRARRPACSDNCSPKAKPGRSGTNRRGRRRSKPRACITWRRLPN